MLFSWEKVYISIIGQIKDIYFPLGTINFSVLTVQSWRNNYCYKQILYSFNTIVVLHCYINIGRSFSLFRLSYLYFFLFQKSDNYYCSRELIKETITIIIFKCMPVIMKRIWCWETQLIKKTIAEHFILQIYVPFCL